MWAFPAWLLADFLSCLFHFLGDVLEINTFVEHHSDPMKMSKHSYMYRNEEIWIISAVLHPWLISTFSGAAPLWTFAMLMAIHSNEMHLW